MNFLVKIGAMVLIVSSLSGCDVSTPIRTNDGWIITKYSGGVIVDVWKLNHNSDYGVESQFDLAIGFVDNDGNTISVIGDTKVKHYDDQNGKEWNAIVEYHLEVDGVPYTDKAKAK